MILQFVTFSMNDLLALIEKITGKKLSVWFVISKVPIIRSLALFVGPFRIYVHVVNKHIIFLQMKPYPGAKLVVRMARYGCTNRPFYQIVVTWNRYPRDRKIKEQLGFYDSLPNLTGEQVLGLNLDRIRHHFKHGTEFTRPVLQLLGMMKTWFM